MPKHLSALFIVKHREDYGCQRDDLSNEQRSGLYNSARFVSEMLKSLGIESAIAIVNDNNDIQREVVKHKATHVFIEALWVVPEKLKLLANLHHRVKWIVRIHSNSPFLANEGVAMEWLKTYHRIKIDNVWIAPNSADLLDDLAAIGVNKTCLLPNHYALGKATRHPVDKHPSDVYVSSFGAIRPMKNQLSQAIAAIKFAESIGKHLVFHMNSSRVEQNGGNALKNIRALFDGARHKLVEHEWLKHEDFLRVIAGMDINLQVSLSETFNIVAADSVNEMVPVVVSREIGWVNSKFHASPNSTADICDKMLSIWHGDRKRIASDNWLGLHKYNLAAQDAWLSFLVG